MMIDKDKFCKGLSKAKDIRKIQDDIYNLGNASDPSALFNLDFPTMIDDYIEMLEIVMNDRNHWISWWCFDLEFGAKYRDGCVLDYDGKNIDLSTAEKLYDFLLSDLSEENFNEYY